MADAVDCTAHENCKRAYPCDPCYREDHPDDTMPYLFGMWCARHRETAPTSTSARTVTEAPPACTKCGHRDQETP